MDREQATEIHAELLEAALALCRAEGAIFINLDKKGRAAFAEPLDKVVSALTTRFCLSNMTSFPT